MDKKEKALLEIELAEKGFMKMETAEFENSVSPDNRIVAIFGKGRDKELFVIGQEKMDALDVKYKDCVDEFPDMKFYNQRIKRDEFEITPLDNMELLEKHESAMRNKQIVENRNTSKTKRSVRGLR